MKTGRNSGAVAKALGFGAILPGILAIVGFSDLGGIFWMLSIAIGIAGLLWGLMALPSHDSKAVRTGIVASVVALLLAVVQCLLVGAAFARQ